MNIREELKSGRSKAHMLKLQDHIGDDQKKFSELMDVFLNDTPKLMENAAWALSHCVDAHPELATPYVKYFIPHARNAPHQAITRNIVRVLQVCPLEEDDKGPVFDLCWDLAQSSKADIAIRAFSITVLARIAEEYDDLAAEVFALASGFQETDSPGLRSRGRTVAKQMQKVIENRSDQNRDS